MTPMDFTLLTFGAALMLAFFMGSNLLLCAAGDDADMKIAPKSFSGAKKARDHSEAQAEAQDYLRQKSSGNIDLARTLGERYASLLMDEARQNFDPWPADMAQSLRAHHRLLLLSYVVNRVVAELCSSSILSQTTINVFYNEIEQKAPQLEKYIKDMASYSLYILCERSDTCSEDEIGKIYARLCGDKDNQSLIDEGNHYYRDYRRACEELHSQIGYVRV